MSGNHGGDLNRALQLVDAAAASGAELLKIQTYTADTLTIDVDLPAFRVSENQQLWGGRTLYQLYEEAHTPWEWHKEIFERARDKGLTPFSSPFDPTAVELLESLECELYKVASAEIVDVPLIREIAGTGKPVVISTGMATVAEIEAAAEACRSAGNERLVLLACTAAYPASPEDARLANIALLRDLFGCPVGLSDHTLGIGVAVAAVAMGAVLVEKHLTLRRHDGFVDSEFSMTPEELTSLVQETERAWRAATGPAHVGPTPDEEAVRALRRSLYVVAPVAAGDEVSAANVRSIRPGGGLPPDDFRRVRGRRFTSAAEPGTPLTWNLL